MELTLSSPPSRTSVAGLSGLSHSSCGGGRGHRVDVEVRWLRVTSPFFPLFPTLLPRFASLFSLSVLTFSASWRSFSHFRPAFALKFTFNPNLLGENIDASGASLRSFSLARRRRLHWRGQGSSVAPKSRGSRPHFLSHRCMHHGMLLVNGTCGCAHFGRVNSSNLASPSSFRDTR